MASKYGAQQYGANLYSSAVMPLEATALNFTVSMGAASLTELELLQGSLPYSVILAGRLSELEQLQGSIPYTLTLGSPKITRLPGVKGNVPFSVFFTASVTESEPLVGQISPLVSLSGRLTESEPLQGTPISFSLNINGRLTESEPLQGALTFGWSMSGILLDINRFTGNVGFALALSGEMKRVADNRVVGDPLIISLDLQGRLTRRRPLAGLLNFALVLDGSNVYMGPFWVPDVPVDGNWVPDVPVEDGWVPASISAGAWVADVPVDPFWVPISDEPQWGR